MKLRRIFSALLACALLTGCTAALAETVIMDGQVVAAETYTQLAPIGGTVETVVVSAGDHVAVGDTIAQLLPTTVYAQQSGTVAVFGNPGESVDTVTNEYGAVVTIEQDSALTIAATTDRAYVKNDNRIIHPGETVYLRKPSDTKVTGQGRVTTVKGSDYTVKVEDGAFSLDDTVRIYRSEDFKDTSRIGQGTVSRLDPVTYSGTGSIVEIFVTDGAHVDKGDALFSTLNDSFDSIDAAGSDITSQVDGVIASVGLNQGGVIAKNAVVCDIWPDDAMQVRATVSENDIGYIAVGDVVTIEFDSIRDTDVYGLVDKISMMAADTNASSAEYAVYISFTETDGIRYGMHATVTRSDDDNEAAVEEADDVAEEDIDDDATAESADD